MDFEPQIDVSRLRKMTRAEYDALIEIGFFKKEDHTELLYGRLVETSPQGEPHMVCVTRLTYRFTRALDEARASVRTQGPFDAGDDSVPEPDIAIVPPSDAKVYPTKAFLLVEVCDSSLREDRKIKLPLYALAAVPEVWLVDVKLKRVEVYSEPRGPGYAKTAIHESDAKIAPLALPDVQISLSEIFA